MSRRWDAMYRRAFEDAFLRYRGEGVGEDEAIVLAEARVADELYRYCDDRLEEMKLERRR